MLVEHGVPFIFVTGYDEGVIPPDLAVAPRLAKPLRELEVVPALTRLEGMQPNLPI